MTAAERVEEAVELGVEDLRTFGREVYVRVGVPAGDAAVVVEVQLDADPAASTPTGWAVAGFDEVAQTLSIGVPGGRPVPAD